MPESDSESFQRLFISFKRTDTRIVSLVVYRNSSHLLGPPLQMETYIVAFLSVGYSATV